MNKQRSWAPSGHSCGVHLQARSYLFTKYAAPYIVSRCGHFNMFNYSMKLTISLKQLNWTDWFYFWWRLCVFDFMALVSECYRTIGEALKDRRLTKGYCYSIHERVWIWWDCNGWCWFERIGSLKKRKIHFLSIVLVS